MFLFYGIEKNATEWLRNNWFRSFVSVPAIRTTENHVKCMQSMRPLEVRMTSSVWAMDDIKKQMQEQMDFAEKQTKNNESKTAAII